MDQMQEHDPDWVGDPRISTLKRMAFEAERNFRSIESNLSMEVSNRVGNENHLQSQIDLLLAETAKLKKENSIATLYFKGVITKEQATRLWDLYSSPDGENHQVADATIEELTLSLYK